MIIPILAGALLASATDKKEADEPKSLAAPRHEGIAKEALTECGRLKPGYRYAGGGKIVKVEPKKKGSKYSQLLNLFAANCKTALKEIDFEKTRKKFKPGDKWSSNFDYKGMLVFGSKVTTKTPLATLEKLFDSMEDVNYHEDSKPLWEAIVLKRKEAKSGGGSKEDLKRKILEIKKKLSVAGLGSALEDPQITQCSLTGAYLADGHTIFTQEDAEQYGDDEELEALGKATTQEIQQAINEMILDKLNTGEELPPWKKSWIAISPIRAQNFISKKNYTGSNSVILNSILGSVMPTPYYLTFNQVKKLKGRVKKGVKGIPLVYYNFIYKLKDRSNNPALESELLSRIGGFKIVRNKKTITINKGNYTSLSLREEEIKILRKDHGLTYTDFNVIKFLNYFLVWNIADTEGIEYELPEPVKLTPKERIDRCESLVKSWKEMAPLKEHKQRAFYRPSEDSIYMPHIDQFDTSEEYYSTLFHEMIHATKHESRLNRDKDYEGKEKEAVYAFEELIAELGASFLCGMVGILDVTSINATAYLKGWRDRLIEVAGDNPNFLIYASREAQKAADYIIKDWEYEEEEGEPGEPGPTPAPEPEPAPAPSGDSKEKAKARARALKLKLKLKLK